MYKKVLLLALIGLTVTLLSACQPQQTFQQRFLQFGTIIDITLITGDQDKAITVFKEIESLLIKRHTEWHGWQDGTLKQFNLALSSQSTAGQNINTSKGIVIPETLRLLISYSKKYYTLSGGLFNPAMGQLIDAWGFHQSSTPNHLLINKIKQNVPGMHDLVVKNNQAFSLNPFLQLDFGAIAKGLAIQQIKTLIEKNHIQHFIINAGGDIFAQGKKQDRNWRVAIENPFYADEKTDKIIGSLQVSNPISIFTSGNYRRFYIDKNNVKRHHIIDPVSGEPSVNISAITVLHDDPLIADIAATALMLTPISNLKNMAEKLEIKDFLAISDKQELYISQSMQQKIEWSEKHTLLTHVL